MSHREASWFEAAGVPDDGAPVHLAVANPETKRVGGWSTPRADTRTACGETWGGQDRYLDTQRLIPGTSIDGPAKHVTAVVKWVTCPGCLAWLASPAAEGCKETEDGTVLYENPHARGLDAWIKNRPTDSALRRRRGIPDNDPW